MRDGPVQRRGPRSPREQEQSAGPPPEPSVVPDPGADPGRDALRSRRRSWPKSARICKRPDFVRVQDHGRRRSGRHLVVLALPPVRSADGPRFGIVVSRKVGNAVVRNRVKRRLREALRHLREDVMAEEIVIIARTSAAAADGAELAAEVAALLRKAGLWARRAPGAGDGAGPRQDRVASDREVG